jgi:2-dehydropantoate 2-reductase
MQSTTGSPRILVVGCGGIGGIVASYLRELGGSVSAVTGNPKVANALVTTGARVREDGATRTIQGIVAFPELPEKIEPFDFILLSTQPQDVERSAAVVARALAPNGRIVCLQNGLCEYRVARIVPPEQVLGAVVAWGGSQLEPGSYDRTSAGGFVIGRIDGKNATDDPRVTELARLLECIGPTTITNNLAGARWSKLAINCAISALGTIGGDRLGVLMRSRRVRRLALEIMSEVVLVARHEGIALEKVSGTLDLDWLSLTPNERTMTGGPSLVAKHTLLLAVGTRFRRLRSSMLAAIERGRPGAIDFLNGEVVQLAAAAGLDVPVNAAVQRLIHEIGRREKTSSIQLIYQLYEQTSFVRTEGGAPPESMAPSDDSYLR